MKKFITFFLAAVLISASSQLFAQADIKSAEEKKQKNQMMKSSGKDIKTDQKGQAVGYTKSGQIIMSPVATPDTLKERTGKPGTVRVKSIEKPSGSILYDRMGNVKATIGQDGKIYDYAGELLGQFTKKGEYLGPDGRLLGTVKNGLITGRKGKEIGKIYKEGKVTNAKGKLLGNIYDDGTIRNSKGSYLGSAPGVDMNIAAVIYFYHKKSSREEKKQNKKKEPTFDVKPIGNQ